MLGIFSTVTPFIKLNPEKVRIDNFVYHLYYRWTFVILIVFTILITSTQFFGDHIRCISDMATEKVQENVINSFCFFTPTFNLDTNESISTSNPLLAVGIGDTTGKPITRHAYYQWVPFVLFLQSFSFYMPHAIWKSWEGGRIKALVCGLKCLHLTPFVQSKSEIGNLKILHREEVDERGNNIRRTMIDRMRLNQFWGARLVLTEILNLLNLLLQIYLTNLFLGGKFYSLGPKIMQDFEKMHVLEQVFPKRTMCIFRNFGPGGSLQTFNILCVMSLNIIYEKIFSALWFWYSALLFLTILSLIWRVITIFLYKNEKFSWFIFGRANLGRIKRHDLHAVVQKCNFSNWMFLLFLRESIADFLFDKIITDLASDLHGKQKKENGTTTTINAKDITCVKRNIDTVDCSTF